MYYNYLEWLLLCTQMGEIFGRDQPLADDQLVQVGREGAGGVHAEPLSRHGAAWVRGDRAAGRLEHLELLLQQYHLSRIVWSGVHRRGGI